MACLWCLQYCATPPVAPVLCKSSQFLLAEHYHTGPEAAQMDCARAKALLSVAQEPRELTVSNKLLLGSPPCGGEDIPIFQGGVRAWSSCAVVHTCQKPTWMG